MILLITRKFPPSIGGMEKLSFQLYQNLTRNIPVALISWGKSQKLLPIFILWAFFRATIYLFRNYIEVIYLGDPVLSPIGLILGYIFHRPVVVNAHGLDITYPNPIYQKILSFCLPKMDHIICISRHTRDRCVELGVSLSNIAVIYPGMDIMNYSPSIPYGQKVSFLEEVGINYRDQKILISVGRLVSRKGIAPFIRNALPILMKISGQWMYIIIGEGPELENINSAIKDTGLVEYVKCLGILDEATLKRAYGLSDVFIMPNIHIPQEPEGFGLVSIEAQASGLPVVLSDLEGIRDTIVEGSDVSLVKPEDWNAFAESIYLWMNREDTPNIRLERQKTVYKHFDWQYVTPKVLDLLNSIVMGYQRK